MESWPSVAETKRPNVYIVAGPNGAGKSTFARRFLPDYADCKDAGLSPFNPESLAIQAGRLMLERIETLARARTDFGFETTLAGRSPEETVRRRFARGLSNFFHVYQDLLDTYLIFDNSGSSPRPVASRIEDQPPFVLDSTYLLPYLDPVFSTTYEVGWLVFN